MQKLLLLLLVFHVANYEEALLQISFLATTDQIPQNPPKIPPRRTQPSKNSSEKRNPSHQKFLGEKLNSGKNSSNEKHPIPTNNSWNKKNPTTHQKILPRKNPTKILWKKNPTQQIFWEEDSSTRKFSNSFIHSITHSSRFPQILAQTS
jgi:hypothetical protein